MNVPKQSTSVDGLLDTVLWLDLKFEATIENTKVTYCISSKEHRDVHYKIQLLGTSFKRGQDLSEDGV